MHTPNAAFRAVLILGAILIGAPALADESMVELAAQRGCLICHTIEHSAAARPLAPSYRDIAGRYKDKKDANKYLAKRVLEGTQSSFQAWSDIAMRFMPPNVNVSDIEARKLVSWILSLDPAGAEPGLVKHESLLALATTSGCMACHSVDQPHGSSAVPLAPPYRKIAERYRTRKDAAAYLVDRVMKGTAGGTQNWSEQVNMLFMPPNVALNEKDAARLVEWILSLDAR